MKYIARLTDSGGRRKPLIYLSVLLLVAGILVIGTGGSGHGPTGAFADTEMVVYKSPTCGCCGVYIEYAARRGFETDVRSVSRVEPTKEQYDIPRQVWSCHTSIVEGYVIEGHVPAEAIEKLLKEQPDIAGIALPGMPSGSPGMPGPKQGEWLIYAINNDGSLSEFMRM